MVACGSTGPVLELVGGRIVGPVAGAEAGA